MSNALAIAGVTAVLRDLLNDGMINNDVSAELGKDVNVSAKPPDKVLSGGTESPQLNVFLHQVTPNLGWRNEELPSQDRSGRRVNNPPLALDLHYIISAYGEESLHTDILLGYAMQLLHETPVLDRSAIDRALPPPAPGVGTQLPPALRALGKSGLADQIEQIKITPEYLNTEEMSKLWTALQSHYRPTAAYLVTVVLIERQRPVVVPLPVLTRGPIDPDTEHEQGIVTQPNVIPPVPTVEKIELPENQTTVVVDKTIIIKGHHLSGNNLRVQFEHSRSHETVEIPIADDSKDTTDTQINIHIPKNQPDKWEVGNYMVTVWLDRSDQSGLRKTNSLSFILAPTMELSVKEDQPEPAVVRNGERVSVKIKCKPRIRPNQTASLLLGRYEAIAQEKERTDPVSELSFVYKKLPAGDYPARLRIDGVDSWFINKKDSPPVFSKIVTVPA